MRVLAHIHTFNDAAVITRTVNALQQQTRPVDGILIVDNASTDGTLDQIPIAQATVLRQQENLGTSGAVHVGFRYGLEHRYDWIWLFDADSLPEPEALERLLELYSGWPLAQREATAFIACVHHHVQDDVTRYGGVFRDGFFAPITRRPTESCYPCHATIWSGCLYQLAITPRVGLPNADYVLDWGEIEYGYRVMKGGYQGYTCLDAILHHNYDHTRAAPDPRRISRTRMTREFLPIRCYYTCRNVLYFAFYEFAEARFGFVQRSVLQVLLFQLRYLLRPRQHLRHITAGLRGMWHGLTGNIAARY